MIDWDLIKAQRELVDTSFSKGKDHVNLVIGAGYAGFFALWALVKAHLTATTTYLSGLLIALSLASFIGWELYSMYFRSKAGFALAAATDDPERFVELVRKFQDVTHRQSAYLAQLYPFVLLTTAGFGFLAIAVMTSGFVHGLWLNLRASITPLEIQSIGTATAIGIGASVAVVASLVLFLFQQWNGTRRGRKQLARAIREELRVAASIYSSLDEEWHSESKIPVAMLDEIGASRIDYVDARSHMWLIRSDELRLRLQAYYRKSAVCIDALRSLGAENDRLFEASVARAGEQTVLEESLAKAADETAADKLAKVRGYMATLDGLIESVEKKIEGKLDELKHYREQALLYASMLDR